MTKVTMNMCGTLMPEGAPRGEELLIRCDGAAELRDVVLEHLAESARLEEIPLHIDRDQRAFGRYEIKWVGFRVDTQDLFTIH